MAPLGNLSRCRSGTLFAPVRRLPLTSRHLGSCELSRVPGNTACKRKSSMVCQASLQTRRGLVGAAVLLSGSMLLSPLAQADLVSSRVML